MQGKTWRELAKSFQNVLNGSYSQAVRNARTSYTSAQNSSRIEGLEEFAKAGIKVQKEWLATSDERTRQSHAELNGVRVDVDKKFPNGLMYPADPDGEPSEVYNCRCKVVAYFPNISKDRGTGKSVESYNKWLEENETKTRIGLSANSTGNTSKGVAEYVGHIDVSNKKLVQSYLNNTEKELVKNDYETACVVLKNGDIYKVKGDSSSVDIYCIEKSLENSYMYHNHPENETWYSFSADDIGVFLGNKVKYSKASDYKYEYEMERTSKTNNVSFKEAYHEFSEYMKDASILNKCYLAQINPDEDRQHEVMKILAEKYNFNYSRKLKE